MEWNGHTDREQYDLMREKIRRKRQKNERGFVYGKENCVSVQWVWPQRTDLLHRARQENETLCHLKRVVSCSESISLIWKRIFDISKEVNCLFWIRHCHHRTNQTTGQTVSLQPAPAPFLEGRVGGEVKGKRESGWGLSWGLQTETILTAAEEYYTNNKGLANTYRVRGRAAPGRCQAATTGGSTGRLHTQRSQQFRYSWRSRGGPGDLLGSRIFTFIGCDFVQFHFPGGEAHPESTETAAVRRELCAGWHPSCPYTRSQARFKSWKFFPFVFQSGKGWTF